MASDASGHARILRTLFGDRTGILIWLIVLLAAGLIWQHRVVLNDSLTFLNGLIAVADGQFHLQEFPYNQFGNQINPNGTTPGTYVANGRVYARNYGHLVAALPFLWVYQLLTRVVAPAVLMPALWSLLLIAAGRHTAKLLSDYSWLEGAVAVVAVGLFGLNVWQAPYLAPDRIPVLALQSVTVVAAAFMAVFVYRIGLRVLDRPSAIVVSLGGVLATPVLFWAPIAKRHTLTGLLIVLTIYAFLRSRQADTPRQTQRWRAISYGWPGLLAWVNGLEALALAAALGMVDLVTMPTITSRRVATAAGGLVVGALPFFVTNALITGNPFIPTEVLPRYSSEAVRVAANATATTGGPQSTTSQTTSQPFDVIYWLTGGLINAPATVDRIVFFLTRGVRTVVTQPSVVVHILIREGWPFGAGIENGNLAVLEGAPVIGGLIALPLWVQQRPPSTPSEWSPRRQLDLLIGVVVFTFVLVGFPSPPNHAQITSRYLTPIIPWLVYAAIRVPVIRRTVQEHWRVMAWSYAGGMFIGGQLLVVGLVVAQPGPVAGRRLVGLVNLVLAGGLGAWAVGTTYNGETVWNARLGAVLVGLALAAGTVTVLLFGWMLVTSGGYVLPIVRHFQHIQL